MAQKILFLHGFFASGTCIPALALKEYFSGKATVLSPDLPLHPQETLDFIQRLCNQEQPDILVGNSNGSFLVQIVASKNNIPALLGNPHFEMTRFLIERIGSHEYKSPRANGNQQLVINQTLIDEFAELQQHQWDNCRVANHATAEITGDDRTGGGIGIFVYRGQRRGIQQLAVTKIDYDKIGRASCRERV